MKLRTSLTTKEVQEIFGISRTTLFDWRKKGLIKAIKIGRIVRFDKSEIERILNN